MPSSPNVSPCGCYVSLGIVAAETFACSQEPASTGFAAGAL